MGREYCVVICSRYSDFLEDNTSNKSEIIYKNVKLTFDHADWL